MHILKYGEIILACAWLTQTFLTRVACFVAHQTCIVYLLWPLKRGVHLNLKWNSCGSDIQVAIVDVIFRHAPVILKT